MEQSVAAANAHADGYKKALEAQTGEKLSIRIASARTDSELENVRSYLCDLTDTQPLVAGAEISRRPKERNF